MSLANYPYKALSQDVVELLKRTARSVSSSGSTGHETVFKLFECYCDLLETQVTYLDLSSSRYLDLVRGFMGAVMSDSFVDSHAARRRAIVRLMTVTHQTVCKEIPALERVELDNASLALNDEIWQEHRSKLCPVRMRYWNGWITETSKGKEFYLALPCIWTSHGQEFTEDFFLQIF